MVTDHTASVIRARALLGASAALLCLGSVPPPRAEWITLGTAAGPIPSVDRSQPANLLTAGEEVILVDCGDGAAGQLAKAGFGVGALDAIALSHLHADHFGGLGAILAMRLQTADQGKLMIYGPPGTRELTEGILASLRPLQMLSHAVGSKAGTADGIEVIEIGDGAEFRLGAVEVSARANNHYPPVANPAEAALHTSLAFRFTAKGRSIVYTGDTGPSSAVVELSQGADLLVTEMMDVDKVVAAIPSLQGGSPAGPSSTGVRQILMRFHLVPEQVGILATQARVKRLIITHVGTPGGTEEDERRYLWTIRKSYKGPVSIARDLDRF